MAKNFIQPGRVLTAIATAAVKSGDLVFIGTLFGVATTSAGIGEQFELITEGVFELPKTSAQAWTAGAAIHWDSANAVCTTTASGNTKIGHATEAAANPSATGKVRLSI